jgi:uncharacterized protein
MSSIGSVRAVFDTNLFVSALISPGGLPALLLANWRQRRFQLLLTPDLSQEIRTVLHRPRLIQRYGLTTEEITTLLSLVTRRALPIEPHPDVGVSVRDPKDEMVLAAALAGADYLVTGDDDLLVLTGAPSLGTLQIVSPRQFLEALGLSPS